MHDHAKRPKPIRRAGTKRSARLQDDKAAVDATSMLDVQRALGNQATLRLVEREKAAGSHPAPAAIRRQPVPKTKDGTEKGRSGEKEEIPTVTVFVAPEKRRTDKQYAEKVGKADAARIRAEGTLKPKSELRAELNAKLKFFEGDAWKAYGEAIKPALQQALAGGVADVTNLEQDMRIVLQEWKEAAGDGVQQFVTTNLSGRLDELESGSWKSFIASLVGNTIWAAAAFTPVGMASTAFAISMTGIAVAAAPVVPSKSKSALPDVQKLMQNYIYSVYDQLNKQLRDKATLLIKSRPGITRYAALGEFMSASFRPGYYVFDKDSETLPQLEKSAIRDRYDQVAADTLEGYTAQIGAVPPHEYLVNEIGWIKQSGARKLALVRVDYFCGNGTCAPHDFIKWIPKESEKTAIDRWKAIPGSGGNVRTFDESEIHFGKDRSFDTSEIKE